MLYLANAFDLLIEQKAVEDGVKVLYQKCAEQATGTCAVLVNGGERSLVANIGAANSFTASHLDTPEAKEAIALSQIVYISGFFLTVSVDSIDILAKHCVANGKIFTMNLVSNARKLTELKLFTPSYTTLHSPLPS